MRPLTIDLPAEEARALMLSRMAGLAEQELDDIVILRSPPIATGTAWRSS